MAKDCGHTKPCGCEDTPLTTNPPCGDGPECNDPNPCPEVFEARCVYYTGEDIVVNEEVIVPQGTNLQDAIQIMTSFVTDITSTLSSQLFAQLANSVPVAATTAEGTIVGSGQGTLTVDADQFAVGDSFMVTMSGHISSANNENLRIQVKSGSVILADTGNINLPQLTNQHWDLRLEFTIRQIGPAGTASIASALKFTYTKDASNAFEGDNFTIINNTTFNTEISNTLDVTATWGSTNAQNSIYSELFVLNKL